MTEIKKDILNGFIFRAITMLCGVVIIPLMSNLTEKHSLGIWFTILGVLQWISMMDFGLSSGIRNRIAELRSKNCSAYDICSCVVRGFYTLTIIVTLAVFIVSILVVILPISIVFGAVNVGDVGMVKSILITSIIAAGINLVLSLSTQVLAAYEKPVYFTFVPLVSSVSYFLWIWFSNVFNVYGVINLSAGYLFSMLMSGVVGVFFMLRTLPNVSIGKLIQIDSRFDFSLIKGFGIQLFLIQLSAVLLFTMPKFLISKNLGASSVVDFEIAQKIMMFGIVFFTIIMNSFWSSFTIAWASGRVHWLEKTLKKLTLLMFPVILGAILYYYFAGKVVMLWMGEDYKPSNQLLLAFSIYFVLTCWNNIFGAFLNGISKTRVQLILSVISVTLVVPISTYLIDCFGIGGAVFGLCVVMLPFSIVAPLYTKIVISKKLTMEN